MEGVGQERDETEEPEETGHGALDCPLVPLSLGRDAEMAASLLEGHLDVPASDVARDDLRRGDLLVGAEQGRRTERADRIA